MKRIAIYTFAILFIFTIDKKSLADDVTLAKGYCYDMEALINKLASFTSTKCLPAKGTTGFSFIFLSSEPVFSVPAAKKAWLLSIVGAFGNTFNKNTMISDEVIVSDMNSMKQRINYKIPAPIARKLQRQIKTNQIGLEEMYREILTNLKQHKIP